MERPKTEEALLAYLEKTFVPKYGHIVSYSPFRNLLKQADRFRDYKFANGTVVTMARDWQNAWYRQKTKVAKVVAPIPSRSVDL